MRTTLFLLLAVILFSCSKNEDENIIPETQPAHVLVLGTMSDSLVVWKDDTLKVLHTDYQPQSRSIPGQIIAVDTNIYIAGGSENNKAVYYKNGIKTTLAQYYSYASSISVSNGHVYVAGFSMDNNGQNLGETYLTYWEDGVRHTSYDPNSQYNFVLKKGNDLYLTGFLGGYASMVYLDNNVPSNFSTYAAEANRIAFNGADEYVIGNMYLNGFESHATLWKNGVETFLNNLQGNSEANAIFIKGNDVYIAGRINSDAVYWKNGVAVYLGNYATAWDIKVVGEDVYVVGQYFNVLTNNFEASLWKNGERKALASAGYMANAFSLVVME